MTWGVKTPPQGRATRGFQNQIPPQAVGLHNHTPRDSGYFPWRVRSRDICQTSAGVFLKCEVLYKLKWLLQLF